MIGYLHKDLRTLILIMLKMSGYVMKFKVENKNSKFMSFCIDNEKSLEKYKAIWTKIEDLKKWMKCFTSLWWKTYKNQNRNIQR